MKNCKLSRMILSLMVLLLCLSVFSLPAFAEETTTEAEAMEVAPTFILAFDVDGQVKPFTAFYVKDTFGDGSTYLISTAEAARYAMEGYESKLLGAGYSETAVYQGWVGYVSYFSAPGLEKFIPYEMNEYFPEYVRISHVKVEEDERVTELSDIFNMSEEFVDFGGFYLADEYIEETGLMGAPVVDIDGVRVSGMMSRNEDNRIAVVNMLDVVFLQEAAILNGAGDVVAEEPKEIDPMVIYIGIGVLVLLVIIVAANRKPKSKGETNAQVQSAPITGNESNSGVKDFEMVSDLVGFNHTVPSGGLGNLAPAKWQIRCIRGSLEGKTYPIQGKLSVGRMSGAQVKFPEGTRGVSGSHCEILVENGQVVLRDLNSTYGTYMGAGLRTKLKPNVSYNLQVGEEFCLAEGGPVFRLENLGGSIKPETFTVRGANGTLYKANTSGEITFGRNADSVVTFDGQNTRVSANHCKLFKKDGALYLMDQGSTNGTFFAEGRLKPNVPYKVKKGAQFYLVSQSNSFVITEE